MDKYNPVKHAAMELQSLSKISQDLVVSRDQDGLKHLGVFMLDNIGVTPTGNQFKQWRLCTGEDSDGVIFKNELVPKNVNECGPKKALYLTQYVEIIGIQTEVFSTCVSNLLSVHEKFAQHLAGMQMAELIIKSIGKAQIFSASNRVDTIGKLAKLKGSDLIHAPENIVKYFRINTGDSNETGQYIPCVPGAFKAGDIVEMQVVFVAQMSNKRIKIGNRLQALTLLNDKFTKEASIARNAEIMNPRRHNTSLRRKVGYFYQDEEDLRARKKRNEGKSTEPEDDKE
ncbi:hypothetical protein B0H17DRAFT_1212546 [Mycena rosella]|uniref:Uncharacterized protein n=1 Tax=Mycena rosella TaxID=1033263 RepID=A0AAD7CSC8_MYCRO|nr:hypothetical protein B0H17DRAFT_1212546 [Mycena rosella]